MIELDKMSISEAQNYKNLAEMVHLRKTISKKCTFAA